MFEMIIIPIISAVFAYGVVGSVGSFRVVAVYIPAMIVGICLQCIYEKLKALEAKHVG